MESLGNGKHASDRNLKSTKQMLEIVEKPAYENDNHLLSWVKAGSGYGQALRPLTTESLWRILKA